jgi:hypothetical protein
MPSPNREKDRQGTTTGLVLLCLPLLVVPTYPQNTTFLCTFRASLAGTRDA